MNAFIDSEGTLYITANAIGTSEGFALSCWHERWLAGTSKLVITPTFDKTITHHSIRPDPHPEERKR
jgi:hypothetical protein